MRRTSVATLDLADAKRAGFLNISEVAKDTGVSAKMIRHYESLGLLKAAKRTYGGYRIYDEKDVHLLRFIRRARDLGFGIKEVDRLLGLWQDRRRASADVRRVAQQHLADLDDKIAALESMRRTLEHLIEDCRGDHRPDCPILEDLAQVADQPSRR